MAQLARASSHGRDETVEVFASLSRRLQSLVHRAIKTLDELENDVEDPDLLKRIFLIDHLTTRIRRHAENVAVLGGTVSRRRWSQPVSLTEVLRSSIAEVEQYSRVKLVPPIEGTLRGHAVADVIHLLAELVENASAFSSPDTQVLLRSRIVQSGLAVEVEDRGLGMPEDLERWNALLTGRDHIDVSTLLADGRIGLYVVAVLARRHHIFVQLQNNIYGGVQAVVILPPGLLGDDPAHGPKLASTHRQQTTPASRLAPAATPFAPSAPAQSPAPQDRPPAHSVEASRATAHPPHATGCPPEPVPLPLHASQGTESMVHHSRGHVSGGAAQDQRPKLPKRRAQEHLAPELLKPPANHTTVDHEVETSRVFAQFRRGAGLVDETPSLRPDNSSRY
ncbi:ATP-binding protein [Streptomyces sp. NPDC055709]